MSKCLKDNPNMKWIIGGIIISILIANEVDEESTELIGNILLMRG